VQGRVVQEPGGQPIRKVDIQLQPRDRQTGSYSGNTDAEGKFQIDDVKPGKYRVILDHSGFVQPRGRNGATLNLTSSADSHGLVLHMQVGATIYGKIVDSDGDPMPNVGVQASGIGPVSALAAQSEGYGRTNDLGEYRIANLRAGKYLVSSSPFGPPLLKSSDAPKSSPPTHLNYVRTYYPGTLEKSQAVPVEVHPGDELPLTFTPLTSATFFIRGTVAKPAGAHLAQVLLRSQDGGGVSDNHDATVAEGSFNFQDLLPGSYRAYLLVVDAAAAMAAAQAGVPPQVQVIRLAPPLVVTNSNLDGVHLVPESAGRVHGRFRMDKERKMDWTQLSAMLTPQDSSELASDPLPGGLSISRVRSDGSFDLPNVAAGEYRLAITSSSNTLQDYFTKSVNLDGKDVADSGFTVSGGTYSLDVVVSAEGATIEGTVVDEKGKPVSDATVVAAPDGERRKRLDVWGQDTTDAQGHFRLRGLISGDYTVLAWEDPEGNVRDPEFVRSFQDRGAKVQLEDGARKNISVTVIPALEETP
jgi:protocatechuate 3,4-dioxygenase beta subunit